MRPYVSSAPLEGAGLGMRRAAGAMLLALGLGVAAALLGAWSLALLAPIFVAVCVVWPAVGVVTLIVACALDRVAIGVGGSNVRPDEVAALALAGALLVRLAWTRTPHPQPLSLKGVGSHEVGGVEHDSSPSPASGRGGPGVGAAHIPLLAPLLAYWGANLLSTLAAGGDVARGLSLDVITLDLIVLYIALAGYLRSPGRLMGAVRLWLGVAAVEAVVGALAFALYLGRHAAGPGIQLEPVTGAPMVYGTLYEADIFGSYMSAAFLIALALATDETVRHKTPLYIVCALSALGLLLSGARSAWGATVLGAVLLLALLRLGRGGRRTRLAMRFTGGLLAVAVVVGVGLAFAPSSVTHALWARAQGLLDFGSGSGYGRVLLYKVALAEWRAHPLLGTGPGSFSYRLPGDTAPGPAWLPNLTLQVLHDTGVLGLLAMLWLCAAFYVTTVRALWRAPAGPLRTALGGLIAAITALLIAFQLTPGFTLGYSWALLALGVAASSAVRAAEHEADHTLGAAAA
jgi:O-antigen ligase